MFDAPAETWVGKNDKCAEVGPKDSANVLGPPMARAGVAYTVLKPTESACGGDSGAQYTSDHVSSQRRATSEPPARR
jgi:hypothetical protein